MTGAHAIDFIPSRTAGLARMERFAPQMGAHYARTRNGDLGPGDRTNVSGLSPWVSSRRLGEWELVAAARTHHSLSAADKFIQEVCWRTYFKGWLEHRPGVWTQYRDGVVSQRRAVDADQAVRADYEAALAGRTGIACFDAWVQELNDTGYLHNHTRMWFASIWIYTLGLPWELGADFFLQHLLDGDAASNTCSWRWVGGLHTAGKTYLARADNIRKYTDGRFAPDGLATLAPPLKAVIPTAGPLPRPGPLPDGDIALLVTDADMGVETLRPAGANIAAVSGIDFAPTRCPAGVSDQVCHWSGRLLDDALAACRGLFGVDGVRLDGGEHWLEHAVDWALDTRCSAVVTGYAPVGWTRERLSQLETALAARDIPLVQAHRAWDHAFWPHARKGFFGLKKAIPRTIDDLGSNMAALVG